MLLAQALWRPDYDIGRDPLSMLSLGRLGWVQIVTFTVVGGLVAAFGAGLWREHRPAVVVRVAAVLLVLTGIGLAGVGVFVTDPLAWHGRVHDVATGLAINAGLAAAVVLAVGWWREGRRRTAVYGLATVVVCAALGWSTDSATIAVRHTVVVILLAAWLTTVALVLLRPSPVRTCLLQHRIP